MSVAHVLSEGEIHNCIVKLRQMLSSADSATYAIFADFSQVAEGRDGLSDAVEKARRSTTACAARIEALLKILEKKK